MEKTININGKKFTKNELELELSKFDRPNLEIRDEDSITKVLYANGSYVSCSIYREDVFLRHWPSFIKDLAVLLKIPILTWEKMKDINIEGGEIYLNENYKIGYSFFKSCSIQTKWFSREVFETFIKPILNDPIFKEFLGWKEKGY